MKIWLLKRVENNRAPVYDCNDGFVIRATSEGEAREIAAAQRGDEGAAVWRTAEGSSCEELVADGDSGIILRDFHAG